MNVALYLYLLLSSTYEKLAPMVINTADLTGEQQPVGAVEAMNLGTARIIRIAGNRIERRKLTINRFHWRISHP